MCIRDRDCWGRADRQPQRRRQEASQQERDGLGQMTKVAVFGAGSWGTAFSIVLADAGNDVTIWARREDVCATINDRRENSEYLPGIELPQTISATPVSYTHLTLPT